MTTVGLAVIAGSGFACFLGQGFFVIFSVAIVMGACAGCFFAQAFFVGLAVTIVVGAWVAVVVAEAAGLASGDGHVRSLKNCGINLTV